MIVARLLVERKSVTTTEDWGAYEFLGLPSPADRIMVTHDEVESYLTVLCVHHQPSVADSGVAPSAEVVTQWTGSAPKLR